MQEKALQYQSRKSFSEESENETVSCLNCCTSINICKKRILNIKHPLLYCSNGFIIKLLRPTCIRYNYKKCQTDKIKYSYSKKLKY